MGSLVSDGLSELVCILISVKRRGNKQRSRIMTLTEKLAEIMAEIIAKPMPKQPKK
jgi:hypothetical protein